MAYSCVLQPPQCNMFTLSESWHTNRTEPPHHLSHQWQPSVCCYKPQNAHTDTNRKKHSVRNSFVHGLKLWVSWSGRLVAPMLRFVLHGVSQTVSKLLHVQCCTVAVAVTPPNLVCPTPWYYTWMVQNFINVLIFRVRPRACYVKGSLVPRLLFTEWENSLVNAYIVLVPIFWNHCDVTSTGLCIQKRSRNSKLW